jgi:hypothetical protein
LLADCSPKIKLNCWKQLRSEQRENRRLLSAIRQQAFEPQFVEILAWQITDLVT